jgi:hypothetical protein
MSNCLISWLHNHTKSKRQDFHIEQGHHTVAFTETEDSSVHISENKTKRLRQYNNEKKKFKNEF